MNRPLKIVTDDKIPFLNGVLEPYANVVYSSGKEINNEMLIDADALIIRTRTICNKALLEGTKVKFIATATIGFDHIDTGYCESNRIKWTNAPGCNSESVKQYIASALARLSVKYGFDLREKTIGIIGYGNVGLKVGNLAKALGMKVLVNDPPKQKRDNLLDLVKLDEIKAKADIITFHVPLNKTGIDKTYHMADELFFKSLKPTCIIINSSRGEVIDNTALKSALKNKNIKAAVLDVWENEPYIDLDLLELIDFATPHIAGYSADGKANGTAMSIEAINNFFGLGLKNWFPKNIPLPKNQKITINNKEGDIKKVLNELILNTYDIIEDDKRLRDSVGTFEKQRSDYPVRREFHVYKPVFIIENKPLEKIIKEIGFNI